MFFNFELNMEPYLYLYMYLYMIQSYRVENASNASMPLYTTQGIFVYRGTELDKQHIVQWAKVEIKMLGRWRRR